jgi:hypothetical protein
MLPSEVRRRLLEARALAKINAAGQCVEKTVNMGELFDRMTNAELEAYAKDGTLPEWFSKTVGAVPQEAP